MQVSPLSSMGMAFRIGTGVAVLHLLIFFGVAWLLSIHGTTMAKLVGGQDQGEFITLAYSLVSSGRFEYLNGIPETFRTIGYPATIASILLFTGGWWWSIFIAHALMIGVAAGATTWLGRELGLRPLWAACAGMLFGVSTGTVLLNISTMGSDIMYTMLYVLAACVLWRYSENHSWKAASSIGALAGFATLTRPIGILATMPLLAGIVFLGEASVIERIRKNIVACLLAIVFFVAVTVPWHARNLYVAGEFSLSSLPTYNFVYYNMPLFLSFYHGTSETEERNNILRALNNPNLMSLRGFAYHDELTGMRTDFLKKDAIPYAAYHVYKMIPFFLGSGANVTHAILAIEAPELTLSIFPRIQENLTSEVLSGNWRGVVANLRQFWLVTLERIVWLLVFGLSFLAPLLARGKTRLFFILASIIVLTNAFLTSPVVQPRYRVPAEPFVWTAAIYALYQLRDRWHTLRKPATLLHDV